MASDNNKTSITIKHNTKKRLTDYGKMQESYDGLVNRLLNENTALSTAVDSLMADMSETRLLLGELTSEERDLIFDLLDGPLQSEDSNVRDLAETIEEKIKAVG